MDLPLLLLLLLLLLLSLLLLFSLVLFDDSLPIQSTYIHGSFEPPLSPHSLLFGDNCNNFKHTSHTYQYFRFQGCPSRSLCTFSTFPLLDTFLELNFHDPLQHRLPFKFNSHNFHIWEKRKSLKGLGRATEWWGTTTMYSYTKMCQNDTAM